MIKIKINDNDKNNDKDDDDDNNNDKFMYLFGEKHQMGKAIKKMFVIGEVVSPMVNHG